MIPVFHEVQDQVKQTEKKDTPNEYYNHCWSSDEIGTIYIKKKEGFVSVSYQFLKGEYKIIYTEYDSDFSIFCKYRKEIQQISKLDALPILKALRQKMANL